MRVILVAVLVAACTSSSSVHPVTNRDPGVTPVVLPCGARTIAQLDPLGERSVADCDVVAVGPYLELRERGRPVIRGGEGKPLVALDPRIPGAYGVRVGMSGADVRSRAPGHRHITCTSVAAIECDVRRTAASAACGDPGDDAFRLRFSPLAEPLDVAELDEGAVWALLRDRAIVEVVLEMPC
jgi:hypothetical protein